MLMSSRAVRTTVFMLSLLGGGVLSGIRFRYDFANGWMGMMGLAAAMVAAMFTIWWAEGGEELSRPEIRALGAFPSFAREHAQLKWIIRILIVLSYGLATFNGFDEHEFKLRIIGNENLFVLPWKF